MPGPIVERGDRLTLRTAERSDAAFLQRATTDPEIRYPLGTITPIRRDEVEELVADGDDVQFVVCLDDPDAPTGHPEGDGEDENNDENESPVDPVGAVTLSRLDGDRPSIGYWLLPERRGEGFGEEAAALLLDHAFRTYDVHGVEAGAFDYNDASRTLLESLGFVEESRRREAWFVDGAYRDEVVYGLLREEWADRSIE